MADKHTTQIAVAKIKSKTVLAKAHTHNSREKERLGTSTTTHIDDRRIAFNETIVSALSSENIWKHVMSRITGQSVVDEKDVNRLTKEDLHYADGTKVRKDAVLALEFEMGYPSDLTWYKLDPAGEPIPLGEGDIFNDNMIKSTSQGGMGYFLWPADMKEFDEWKKRSIDFIKENFHEENLLSVEVHMDESFPHMHALIVPLLDDEHGVEKLNCKSLFNNAPSGKLSNYHTLQSAYAARFEDMGYTRGEEYSAQRNMTYSDRSVMRQKAAKVLSEQLPEDRAMAQEMYTASLAKIAMLEEELDLKVERGRQYATLAKKYEKAKNEIRNLKTNAEINQSYRTMREFERAGMKLHPDREMIEDIYKPLQESLIELGCKSLEHSLGIKIDVEYDFDEFDIEHEDN